MAGGVRSRWDGEIVIGTHGRSVWIADLVGVRGWGTEEG
jgi:hypothetical protein